MNRILILMAAPNYAAAQAALESAWLCASTPKVLSFGLCLEQEPDDIDQDAMYKLGRVQFICPASDAWAAMPHLWKGEPYVLMAHYAMRFEKGWDSALLRQQKACLPPKKREGFSAWLQARLPAAVPSGDVQPIRRSEQAAEAQAEELAYTEANDPQPILTGFLPVREDPLQAVCPVGADTLDMMGALTYRHGIPLYHGKKPMQGPFLHPNFCFGPAGFFRMMAESSEDPLFLRAFRTGWALCNPVDPRITLVFDPPLPAAEINPLAEGMADFARTFGMDLESCTLSVRIREGLLDPRPAARLHVSSKEKAYHLWIFHCQMALDYFKTFPRVRCVTLCTSFMPSEMLERLERLASLENLPLTPYVDGALKREVATFLPSACELRAHHLMDVNRPAEEKALLSKAAILYKTGSAQVDVSHHVWLDADTVQYPVYSGMEFCWNRLCTDKIVMAMVEGQPDPSMFIVPSKLLGPLSAAVEACCQSRLNQRGALPDEADMWQTILKENPAWFQLKVLPVRRQLFTLLDERIEE